MWGTLVQGTNAAQWDGYFYYGLAPAGEYYYFINTLDSSNNQRIPITPDGQITVNPTSPPPIWTINGFYQPVDMNGVTNVVRGGQTVPLRFEVFDEYGVERTSVSDISSFTQTRINCGELSGDPQDQIEETNSLLTNLQYNGQTGYYQANWKTPKQPNTCWEAKVTTADGSSLAAFFKLK